MVYPLYYKFSKENILDNIQKCEEISRQKLFLLPDGNQAAEDIEDILQFSLENGVTQILADLPGQRELPKTYEHMGFCKAYLYSCYTLADESPPTPERYCGTGIGGSKKWIYKMKNALW